jgi:hypothetical protein
MKKSLVFALVVFMTALLGCRSTPLVNTFMDPDIPPTGHAVLSVHNNVLISMIDGQMTLKSSGGGGDGIIASKSPIVLLTPGEHTLDVQYYKQTTNVSSGYNTTTYTTTTESSEWLKFTADLEGGHSYRIYPIVEGKSVYIEMIDETDPSVWGGLKFSNNPKRSEALAVKAVKESGKRVAMEQKKVPTVKYPKKLSTLIAYQKAAAAAPTALEGTWLIPDTPEAAKQGLSEQSYIFTGQSFVNRYRKDLSSFEIKMVNMARKVLKAPPITDPVIYGGARGTMEINGNTVTLTFLQMNNDGLAWISNPSMAQIRVSWDYSFDAQNNLVLDYKGDKTDNTITLTKQQE